MTSDRIRWCSGCNLIVSSRKCPECRNDVLNIHLDSRKVSPIFKGHISHMTSKIDEIYGDGCGELLFPDDRTALFEHVGGSRRIIIDGGIVGQLNDNGEVSLNASGLSIISGRISKNSISCDHDSSYFVTKGRNLMVTGVTSHSDDLRRGDVVAVLDEKGKPIAEGVMRISAQELDSLDKGVAVNIRNNQSPRIHTGKNYYNWVETIDANGLSIRALAGETATNIERVVSPYGYPVIVELSSDIVSEANLLLTLDAGIRPSVIIKEQDGFVDFLIEKMGLKTVTSLPDRCIFITERKDASTVDVIAYSPTEDWDPTTVWMYVMQKAEPFDPRYIQS